MSNSRIAITSPTHETNHIIRVLSPDQAKILADRYLPVHLRDFFLGMDSVLQCHFYDLSINGHHFFSLILTEWSRFDNEFARLQSRKRKPGFDAAIIPEERQLIAGPGPQRIPMD